MPRTIICLTLTLAVSVLPVFAQESPKTLWSPGAPETEVDVEGGLHEPWGTLSLRLTSPENMQVTSQQYAEEPVPTVTTIKTAGSVVLKETAYRAPIWPTGVDVLQAVITNTGTGQIPVTLEVPLPENMSFSERLGAVAATTAIALPKQPEPVRQELEWGCLGGAVSLPGWATPSGACDPAFRNIRAGMGGVPITHKFSVEPGSNRVVVLGFCESYWSVPGKRPLAVNVEGCQRKMVDPLALWGQHQPGVLQFDASDANGNGKIEVAVEPHPQAQDKNPILNVIWIISPGTPFTLDEIKEGKWNDKVERYVDVGGDNDQSLYKGGTVTYLLSLGPGASQSLLFLASSPAGGNVPDPMTTAWTEDSLRKAAKDVMRDYVPARWTSAPQQ